jgi:hypothetical protein
LDSPVPVPHVRTPWLWWHVLSLDAPTVAVLWAALFAHALDVSVRGSEIAVLAGSIWLVYAIDRLLDAWRPSDRERLGLRHAFAAAHRVPMLIAIAGVLPIVLGISLRAMPRALLRADVLLLGLVFVYFAAVHVLPRPLRSGPAKKAAVAAIFAAGTALPAWVHAPQRHDALVLPALAFAGVCFVNCTAIDAWEDRRPRPSLRSAAVIVATLSLAAVVAPVQAPALPLLACAASASALLAVECLRPRWSAAAMHVAADAVLLTAIVALRPF